jgi:hypothetical protein
MKRLNAALWAIVLFPVPFLGGCEPRSFPTPLEEAEGDSITSHAEMLAFLADLQEGTGAFTMEAIGTSSEGRDLVLLHFAETQGEGPAPREKLKVLIFTQQHGNEPSGTEAALALARDIATGAFNGLQDRIDLYLIPRVNPDGSEARQRENAEGVDLNRDHLTLSTAEVRAVHDVFQEVKPQVVLDVHEYGITSRAWVDGGIRKNFGEQIGALSNPNMSLNLRTYAWDRVIPAMRDSLVGKDVSLNRYLVSDGPEARFRYSTTALNDGRNSTGIYDALTFLIEGRNGLTVEENLRERARQQLETMKAFLRFFSENAEQVKCVVGREQEVLSGAAVAPVVALVMDYVPDPDRPSVTVGVVDVETGDESSLTIEDFHPLVEPTGFVERPGAYVIPPELTEVIQVLERHRIPMRTLEAPLSAEVETYRITGVDTSVKEDKEFLDVSVSTRRGTMEIPAGHVLVPTLGIQSNLIVTLLEPQSQWGLAPLPEFVWMLEVGSDYPILRVLGLPG